MMKDNHDPRVDPRPGDRLKKGAGRERTVCCRGADGSVCYRVNPPKTLSPFGNRCSIDTWVKWAKRAEVIS